MCDIYVDVNVGQKKIKEKKITDLPNKTITFCQLHVNK